MAKKNVKFLQKDVFLYPGSEKENYGRCEMTEMMDLNEWSNCCDNVCPTMLDRILRRFLTFREILKS